MHKIDVVSVLIGIVITLSCSRGNSSRQDSSHVPRPSAAVVEQSADTMRLSSDSAMLDLPHPARRYRLGVLFPFLAAPFWVNEAYGVLDQASKVGVDVVWLSADGYDNID